jgi:hypothetical protein
VIAVQFCFLAHVLVGFVVERCLARRDVFAFESVACDVVGGPQELIYGIFEECSVGTVHVEFHGDSASLLHTSYVCLLVQKH